MINKSLYIFVGKSASGKTTVANILEQKRGMVQLQSYTTRPKRHENETGHTFISDEEFNQLKNIVAYTKYNGFQYGATKEQVDAIDIYVLDVPGVETILKNYNTDRPISIFYFDTTVHTRINRMIERGDHDSAIISRLLVDEKDNWWEQLEDIIFHKEQKNVQLYVINANNDLADVLRSILWYMD